MKPEEKLSTKNEEQFILNYTSSSKWEQIEKLNWTTSEMMEIMKSYASTQPKRVSDEEILAKFPIDRNATYEDEIRENLDNDRRREGAKWLRDLPSSQEGENLEKAKQEKLRLMCGICHCYLPCDCDSVMDSGCGGGKR